MDRFKVKTPFCGAGDLRSVAIAAGIVYLIFALGGASTGFGFNPTHIGYGSYGNTSSIQNIFELEGAGIGFGYNPTQIGYGSYGENYLLMLLGISSVVSIFSNILLIHGAITRRHRFILPWIYWQLVFVIIASMVLIWSSIVIAELENSGSSGYEELRVAMIAALSCVVPFLSTVIYSSIVVYSLYCELKGVKSKEDKPVTSPQRTNVMPPGNSMSHRVLPTPPKTQDENIYEDEWMHPAGNRTRVMPPGSSTSHRPPPLPPKTQVVENTYDDAQIYTALNNPHSNATKADQGEVYAIYELTLPDRNTDQFI